MSLYSALYSGVSGLAAQSTAMATVGDNISNINTIGYKGVSAQFRTLVTGGSLGSTYSAGGVTAAPQAMISKEGVLQASASGTDLGIEGAGFFVTRSGSGPDADLAFTRAGSFKPDAEGYLRNTSGYYLQGWRLDASGVPGTNPELEAVRVSELTGSAAATSSVKLRANLGADAAVNATFMHTVDVYDAQGGIHRIDLEFTKNSANSWGVQVKTDPAGVRPAGSGVLGSGTVEFNSDGSLKSITPLAAPLGGQLSLQDGKLVLNAGGNLTWGDGTARDADFPPITLGLGSGGKLDGLSQFSGKSERISSSEDGGLLGTIASVEISPEGKVSAIFSDGTARTVFQLPLATFQNPDGLTRLSGNAYIGSGTSGSFAINAPGALGAGTISPGMLEASNVDLAQEFTNMILFQRAYSASSKIITTVDDMLQELSNLKR